MISCPKRTRQFLLTSFACTTSRHRHDISYTASAGILPPPLCSNCRRADRIAKPAPHAVPEGLHNLRAGGRIHKKHHNENRLHSSFAKLADCSIRRQCRGRRRHGGQRKWRSSTSAAAAALRPGEILPADCQQRRRCRVDATQCSDDAQGTQRRNHQSIELVNAGSLRRTKVVKRTTT
jgi:hypothetical protein